MPTRFTLALALALCAALPAHAADTFEAKPICDCTVTSLSADGSAAVGRLPNGEAFLWTAAGGLEKLGRNPYRKDGLTSIDDEAPAVSGDGRRVAATIRDPRSGQAVQGLWTRARGWQVPRVLPPDAGEEEGLASSVSGLSRDGAVVLGYYVRAADDGGRRHASIWTAAGLQDMGSSGGLSRLHAASADGTLLVGVINEPGLLFDRAAVWRGGTWQWITDARASQALAVNAAGDTIAGTAVDATGEYAAAVWRQQAGQWVMQSLGRLPGATGYALATGLSDDGRTVVGLAAWRDGIFPSNQTGFVWTAETGLRPAADHFGGQLPGVGADYRIESIGAISADGQVMGVVARHRHGQRPVYRSFLVRRVPG